MDTLLIIKILILVYIVLSPFINYKHMRFMNSTFIKISILILIILVSFVDLQLAILLMVAFLVFLVNLNKDSVFKVKSSVSSEQNLLPQVLSDIKTLPEKLYTQTLESSRSFTDTMQNTMQTAKDTILVPQDNILVPQKENMVRGNSLFPLPSDIIEAPEKILGDTTGVLERFVDMELEPTLDSRMRRSKLESQVNEQIHEQTYNPLNVQTMSDFPTPYCKGVENIDPYVISNNLFLYSTDERTKPYEEYVKILSPECALKNQTNEI